MTSDKLDVESSASSNLKKQEGTFNDLTFNYSLTSDEKLTVLYNQNTKRRILVLLQVIICEKNDIPFFVFGEKNSGFLYNNEYYESKFKSFIKKIATFLLILLSILSIPL